MTIFQLDDAPEGLYRTLGWIEKDQSYDILQLRDMMRLPTPIGGEWSLARMKLYKKKLPDPAIPTFIGPGVVFSEKAYDCLKALLSKDGEFLKLDVAGGNYYLFHVITCIDCLDLESSSLSFYRNSNLIERWKRLCFLEDAIGEAIIFRIPQDRSNVYVRSQFDEFMIANGLRGYRLQPLE